MPDNVFPYAVQGLFTFTDSSGSQVLNLYPDFVNVGDFLLYFGESNAGSPLTAKISKMFFGFKGGDTGAGLFIYPNLNPGFDGYFFQTLGLSFNDTSGNANIFLNLNGDALVSHLCGTHSSTSAAPIVTVDTAGSGVGATADFSLDANPVDSGFRVKLLTAGTPAANTRVFSVAFGRAYSTKPKILARCSSNGALPGNLMFVDNSSITVNGFNFLSGSSAPVTATTYVYDFIVIQ